MAGGWEMGAPKSLFYSLLLDMVKFVESIKKKQLKDLFKATDKNDDG